ncbi:DUF6913 domain-containing protein [Salegentibacter sediminis]|uniref:DUF6913 domain-containing protein n=1 Tax=Salegentibacter sediminis TaxID=1930251 RepID=UPI0009BDF173|nr:hypothetical protein [Salegentibacter sediminis]
MLESYKIYLAKKRLKAVAPKDASVVPEFKNLLLLYDSPNEGILDSMTGLIKKVGIPEEGFQIIHCGTGEKIREEAIVFQFKDIAYNGKLKNQALMDIIQSGPDLVISYTEKNNPEALFLREVIPARVKAGRFEEKEVNLSINDGNRPEVFTEELTKYLKILKGE